MSDPSSHALVTMEKAKDRVAVFKAHALYKLGKNELGLAIETLLTGCEITCPVIPAGFYICRIRVLSDRPVEHKSMLYPPPAATPMGRANWAKAPLLYCSLSKRAAMLESRVKHGHRVACVTWKTTTDLLLGHVGYSKTAFGKLGGTLRPNG